MEVALANLQVILIKAYYLPRMCDPLFYPWLQGRWNIIKTRNTLKFCSLNELQAHKVSLFYTHILGRNLDRNTVCVTNAAFYSMVHISRAVFLYPRQIDCELACDWVRHLDCVNIITRPGVHPLHWPPSQHHVIPSQVTISNPSPSLYCRESKIKRLKICFNIPWICSCVLELAQGLCEILQCLIAPTSQLSC